MMRWWRPNSSWSLPWSFDSPTHTPVVFYQLPHFWIHFPFLWPPVSKSLRGLTAQQSADTSSCYPCSLEWTWEIYQLGRFVILTWGQSSRSSLFCNPEREDLPASFLYSVIPADRRERVRDNTAAWEVRGMTTPLGHLPLTCGEIFLSQTFMVRGIVRDFVPRQTWQGWNSVC